MTIVRVICKNCGRYLGAYTIHQFGMDDMVSQLQHDPECQYCNPYYYKTCKKCGQKNIDNKGICRVCNIDYSLQVSLGLEECE